MLHMTKCDITILCSQFNPRILNMYSYKGWVKLLWPGETFWQHISWSPLVQVMAWCLIGTKPLPAPMMTQAIGTAKNASKWNFNKYTDDFIMFVFVMADKLSKHQWVNSSCKMHLPWNSCTMHSWMIASRRTLTSGDWHANHYRIALSM